MGTTCHIFLDAPADPRPAVASGDSLVDLRLFSSDVSVFEGLADRDAYLRPDVAHRECHDAALDAYTTWVSHLGDVDVRRGRSLAELLQYDAWLSLWWLLPLNIKHYVKHPLPGTFQRIVWLRAQERATSRFLGLLGEADAVVIHSEEFWSAELFRRALGTHTDIAAPVRLAHDRKRGERGDFDRVARDFSRQVDSASRKLGQVVGLAGSAARRRIRDLGSTESSNTYDMLLVTFLSDWRKTDADPGQYVNRYLADAPKRLLDAGVRAAWLPVVERHEKIAEFRDTLSGAELPVVWDALDASPARAASGMSQVTALRQRVAAARANLSGHPDLSWAGVDLSDLILEEIEAEVDVHGLYHAYLYETTRHAIDTVSPDVVLYRNEFYANGRTIAAAAAGQCERWAYQHATIPRHHWVYRHDASTLEGRRAFERLPVPDRFLTYGPFVTDLMTSHGMPTERFQEIGSLRHDEMFDRARSVDDAQVRAYRRQLGLDQDVPVFLICAQLPAWLSDWIELLVGGLRASDIDAQILVKPHWFYRDVPAIRRTFARLGWDAYSVVDGELDEVIIAADVSLTGSSTTGLESAILGTPLISFLREQPWETMPYVEDGLALPARDLESMQASLEAVLSDDFAASWPARRRRFFREHLCNVEQPACERLVGLLADA